MTARLVVVSFLAAFLLAGCSSGGSSVKETSAPAPGPSPASTAVFLAKVRPLWPNTNTDADLIKGGQLDCAALDGHTRAFMIDELAGFIGSSDLAADNPAVTVGEEKAAVEIDAAIATFCPARAAVTFP